VLCEARSGDRETLPLHHRCRPSTASRKKSARRKPASLETRAARASRFARIHLSAHEKDGLLHVQLGQRDRPRPALRRERAHKTPGLYRCCAEEYGLGGRAPRVASTATAASKFYLQSLQEVLRCVAFNYRACWFRWWRFWAWVERAAAMIRWRRPMHPLE